MPPLSDIPALEIRVQQIGTTWQVLQHNRPVNYCDTLDQALNVAVAAFRARKQCTLVVLPPDNPNMW